MMSPDRFSLVKLLLLSFTHWEWSYLSKGCQPTEVVVLQFFLEGLLLATDGVATEVPNGTPDGYRQTVMITANRRYINHYQKSNKVGVIVSAMTNWPCMMVVQWHLQWLENIVIPYHLKSSHQAMRSLFIFIQILAGQILDSNWCTIQQVNNTNYNSMQPNLFKVYISFLEN